MMSCKQASALMSQSLDRRLSWRERLRLRLHLFACEACRRVKAQLQFLHTALRRPNGLSMGLSPAARERIRRLLEGHDASP